MPCILTLDLGTSYYKAALFDGHGALLALRHITPPIRRDGERWELDADAFRAVIAEMVRSLARDDIAAVVFSTQANSFLLLGQDDAPLTPLILWPDRRAADITVPADLHARNRTGVARTVCEMAPAKLMWLARHQPGVWRQRRRLCFISDYLTLWFTGQFVTEGGAAGLSGLLDIHELGWRAELCEELQLEQSQLPRPVYAGTDVGVIRPEAARELNLPAHCRFIVGCLDQYAGAIGAGNVVPGRPSQTTGTVLAAVSLADRFEIDAPAGVFQGSAFAPGIYWRMAFSSISANLLEWFRHQQPDKPDFAALSAEAAAVPDSGGLRWIGGDNPRDLASAFAEQSTAEGGCATQGLIVAQPPSAVHINLSRGHYVRCIMQTVAEELRRHVQALCGERTPSIIEAAGGGARSDVWLQIMADTLGVPVRAQQCPEPTSLGAAMLAARALGWMDLAESARRWIQPRLICRPAPR